jgi:hypothetical protein
MHTEGSKIIRIYSSLTISFALIRKPLALIRAQKNPGRNGSSAGVKILNRVTI